MAIFLQAEPSQLYGGKNSSLVLNHMITSILVGFIGPVSHIPTAKLRGRWGKLKRYLSACAWWRFQGVKLPVLHTCLPAAGNLMDGWVARKRKLGNSKNV